MRITLMMIAAAALMTPACSAAVDGGEAVAAADAGVEEKLREAMAQLEAQGFSGFAAVQVAGGAPVLVHSGAADPESGRDYDLDTQFDIGSISKSLTGLAVAQLVAEGKLAVDDTIGDFFPDAPPAMAGITVEQLATHTAGFGPAHGADLRPQSRAEMFEAVFAEPLIAAPGERYAYSNTGFSILAAMIEEVTGKGYEDYVVEDVLAPLGLRSTGYWSVYDEARVDAAADRGKVAQASWGGLRDVSWALIGNGGMVSSARDLLALGQAVAGGGIDDATADTWLKPRVDEGGGTHYGFGIVNEELDGAGKAWWHNGGNPAFQTEWWTLADSQTTLVVHRNGGPVPLAEAFGPLLRAVTGQEVAAVPQLAATSELPDTPGGRLARDFLAAVGGSKADFKTFVETRMSAALLEQMPVETHLDMYDMLHADLGGTEVAGVGEEEDRIRLRLKRENDAGLAVTLYLTEEEGQAKLRGLEIG
ncbi:serine hydrolase domain-containing protein [Sphingomicrobium aestuariivivum]|uniref:serine hydrolase domain-containing protein n=1 Tax=Sphingomicrobium aestuariivivum TaxID=1582356 RepID=UPI001FD68CCF|nr:serine hydrolase domain-containing protein [Sphingomicrobium aestuariivivum]MCJ8190231.1 beta-lactamase family protein [Sphingomicrobium aestuariivivum]